MGDSHTRLSGRLRLAVAAAVIFCGLAMGLQAQSAPPTTKTMLVEPPTPLLPAALGKLTRSGDGDVGDGLGKLDAAGLSAQDKAAVAEDGLKRFAKSDYSDGAEHGTVAVFQFADVSGAISGFDYFRRPGPLGAARMGDETAPAESGQIVFRSGVNVVREDFNLHGEHVGVLMGELIDHLPKVGGPKALAPLVPSLLPEKGFDRESVRYALGPKSYAAMGGVVPADAVGFDKSAEVVTAKAENGGLLTLLLYPTPEIAGEHLRMIDAAMKQQGEAAGTVVLRREGPLVAMTSGAWKADAAQAMVDGIHMRSVVTFDKPMPVEFHAEVQKTYSVLMRVVIFSGIGFVAAIVLALFFGGGRALIRVLQGKPAATEPEFLRLDLREAGTTRLENPKV